MYSDDVDSDGKRDILVLGFPGKESWWYQNPGHDKADGGLWKRHTILDSVDNESPLIADIDGDKVLDLICSTKGLLWICIACGTGSDGAVGVSNRFT